MNSPVPDDRQILDSPAWLRSCWLLRWAVVLQLLGWGLEALYEQFREPHYAGVVSLLSDWGTKVETAELWQRGLGWTAIAAAGTLIGLALLGASMRYSSSGYIPALPSMIWHGPLLLFAATLQFITAVATMLHVHKRFVEWTLGEQAISILGPIAFLGMLPTPGRNDIRKTRLHDAVTMLRYAAAATFFTHGMKALGHAESFRDWVIWAGKRIGWEIPAPTLESTLTTIGVIEFLIATLLLLTRWRISPLFFTGWGLVLAFAPLLSRGVNGTGEALVHLMWGVAPFAVYLMWQKAPPRAPTAAT